MIEINIYKQDRVDKVRKAFIYAINDPDASIMTEDEYWNLSSFRKNDTGYEFVIDDPWSLLIIYSKDDNLENISINLAQAISKKLGTYCAAYDFTSNCEGNLRILYPDGKNIPGHSVEVGGRFNIFPIDNPKTVS